MSNTDKNWNDAFKLRPNYNKLIELIVFNPFLDEKRKIDSVFRSNGRYDGVCEGVDEVLMWRYKE